MQSGGAGWGEPIGNEAATPHDGSGRQLNAQRSTTQRSHQSCSSSALIQHPTSTSHSIALFLSQSIAPFATLAPASVIHRSRPPLPLLPLSTMSTRKRPRSPSPPESRFSRPVAIDVCWYYTGATCGRPGCHLAHLSYRPLIADYTNRRPFCDDDVARRQWERSDQFCPYFAASTSSSEQQPQQWVAVLPVPLIRKAWEAFHHQYFHSLMRSVLNRPADATAATVDVLMAKDVCDYRGAKRTWGSVVLRGPREQVERGREAFIELMEQDYHRTANTRLFNSVLQSLSQQWQSSSVHTDSSSPPASPAVLETRGAEPAAAIASPRALDGQLSAVSSLSPSNATSRTTTFTAPSDPAIRQRPCVQYMTRGSCQRSNCALLHESYPALVASLADTTPTSQSVRELSSVERLFKPKLTPLASPGPLVYVVSLPQPCYPAWSSALLGEKKMHARWISRHSKLHHCHFTQTVVSKDEQSRLCAMSRQSDYPWLPVQGEGTALSVDQLLECIFWMVEKKQHCTWLDGTATVEELQNHMDDWERARDGAKLTDGQFFAFRSRGIQFQVPLPPQVLTSSSSSTAWAPTDAATSPVSPVSPPSAFTDTPSPGQASAASASAARSESPTLAPLSLASHPAHRGVMSDTVRNSLPLSPLAEPTVTTASLLSPSSASAEITVAARLAVQMASMHTAGLTVAHKTMDALFDDHCLAASPQCVAFIRLLPTAQFACLPLPLDAMSRYLLICEPFDALPVCPDIETETGVDLYVPPLPDNVDEDGSAAVMCNVQFNVLAVSEQSSEQLEEAVLRVLMRWEAVKQHLSMHGAADTVRH